jgi:hypothetical protein
MDSSDLRLIIGLLFGTFLAIVLVSDLIKRRAQAPKVKERPKQSAGFRRSLKPETPPDGGFRARSSAPEGPRTARNDFRGPRD